MKKAIKIGAVTRYKSENQPLLNSTVNIAGNIIHTPASNEMINRPIKPLKSFLKNSYNISSLLYLHYIIQYYFIPF